MKLPQDGDNELWREGFDWITIKVIAKVRNVRLGSFSHISLYKSVVLKCCPNVLHHVTPQRWYQCCSQSVMVLIDFKGYCQGQKCPIWACFLFRPISQKRCMLWPMFVWHTYIKSYMIFQLTLWHLTFKLPLNVKSRSQTLSSGCVS